MCLIEFLFLKHCCKVGGDPFVTVDVGTVRYVTMTLQRGATRLETVALRGLQVMLFQGKHRIFREELTAID
jgi:hypothetical protein